MKLHTDWSYNKDNPHVNLVNGKRFYFFDFGSEDMDIEAIAHALSRIPRFGGHALSRSYNVAYHSLRVSELLEKQGASLDVQLWGLLHDAAEHVIGDIPTPLKNMMKIKTPWSNTSMLSMVEYEDTVLVAVARRFGLPWPIPKAVHAADWQLFQTESNELFDTDVPTIVYPAECIRLAFLKRFCDLIERRNNARNSSGRNQGDGDSKRSTSKSDERCSSESDTGVL